MYTAFVFLGVFMVSTAYENLAFLKPTWQSSTYNESYTGSEKAVDGLKTNLSFRGKQCSVSVDKQQNATWFVNLTEVSSINSIVIYYRTENQPWGATNHFADRFMGFFVYISNTTDRLTGHLCFHDTNYTTATIPAVANITCPMHGQFVIYYNERPANNSYITGRSHYAFTELCEVEVYGCSGPRRYGSNCSRICPTNCKEYCHIQTGNCLQCNPGYKGERCEQENMAFKKPTGQSTSHDEYTGPEKAVDGQKTDLSYAGHQCSISSNAQTKATWWVNLTEIRSIRNVIIYYRTENLIWGQSNTLTRRFLGFYLYVSNSTNRLDGHLCFHDTNYTNATIPAIANINCPVHGQYVIYYNERLQGVTYPPGYSQYAFNELCEVEVYGCSTTHYGQDCSEPCPTNCYGYCHIKSGNCLQCKPGYKSAHCEQECDDGYFGVNCGLTCGHCLDSDECHHINGTCLTGCDKGYEGTLCNKKCGNRYFGVNCGEMCGHCLDSDKCHHINGTCLTGCDKGYESALCNKTCAYGHFGNNCVNLCNDTCKGCNRTNGVCDSGCQTGWKGVYCHEECDDGYFGVNCGLTCGHCLDSDKCHHINGTCLTGCDKGYEGTLCNKKCGNGYFGVNCGEICGHCLDSDKCHHINGTCLTGCDKGYEGALCNKTCAYGHFGNNCVNLCNDTCKGCNRTNGVCDTGCQAGWEGVYCHEACKEGYFGENCVHKCNATCNGCNRTNGICENGCYPGWKGKFCHEECSGGFFGSNCSLLCGNCSNSEQCQPINGTCINGCKKGYGGVLCNQKNLAYLKPTWQSSTHDTSVSASGRAVDGLKTDLSYGGRECCVSRNAETTATWWVNLEGVRGINFIVIYYRTDNGFWDSSNNYASRFLGFHVYISNTTDISDGYLCFRDINYTRATIPAIANISCPVHGQYVIYYNERLPGVNYPFGYSTYAFVELCEVEVFGCSDPSRYGSDCSYTCSPNCLQYCNIESGQCPQCAPGYKGKWCENECDDGVFGENCSKTCGHCKQSNECHHINGTCLNGCSKGYEGQICNKTCVYGYFGENCVHKCNKTCKGCNRTNGICENGCHPGWKGKFCHEACATGYFGENCAHICNDTCKGCNKTNGICDSGCHPGWKGEFCHKECDGGFYEENCSKQCGNCLNLEQCHPINGTCINGCDAGFKGILCNETCKTGTFGQNCLEICNTTCYGCNRTNGKCDTGCYPGWKGDYCHEQCTGGFYGINCNMTCGNCVNSEQCQPINGTCLNGCDEGFGGIFCNETCKNGTFGRNCLEICNSTCYGCNRTNGKCDTGCYPGWKGDYCHEECDGGFYGSNCNMQCGNCVNLEQCHPVNGTCINGCDEGFEGILCNKTCENGTFGQNCMETCNSTCYGCNRTNGKCESGCHPGWKGNYCQEECDGEYFGENCNIICGHCLNGEQCHHINGSCLNGCAAGFNGSLCTEECLQGYYGRNCQQTCSINCKFYQQCNGTTGACDSGCQVGWKESLCHQVCDNGHFGEGCGNLCGHCNNSEQCHHVNGSCFNGCGKGYQGDYCIEGCSKGYHGSNCLEECSLSCKDRHCWPHNGSCYVMLEQITEADSTPVVGAVVGIIVVLIAAVLLFVAVRRYRKPKEDREISLLQESTKETRFSNVYANATTIREVRKKEGHPGDNLNMEALITNGEETNDNVEDTDDLYMNQLSFTDISIDQLGEVIAEKRKNENEKFRKEYAIFPKGELHKCDAGKRTENVPKNRFKTTYPYDHSRVILRTQDENASDYINASYIDGPTRKKEYIAAQGPKQNTLGEFWSMIWQESISAIVMLTNLREGEKIKCTQYWPDRDKHINYGIVSVKWMEEREYAFYVIRKLKVINKETKKSRVLTHYHYTAWPDHGTPDPLCLIIFHNHVIRTKTNSNTPTVVHCSAGVGRTGTYIALDMLHQIGKNTGKVNVAECVRKMRESRMTMVQTYEQYITIFLTLQEDFKAPMKVDSIEHIKEKIESSGKDTPANQIVLRREFQLLLKIRPNYTEADYKISKERCRHKNDEGILPLDKYSVHLSSYVAKRGNFINAICVPSFTKPRGFIVTQYPSTNVAVDFLRLLIDQECDTVICMDPLKDINSSNEWLPSSSSPKTVPPFEVQGQSYSQTDVNSSTIRIVRDNKEDEAHTVRFVEPKEMTKSSGDPVNTSQLRNLVSAALNTETENPIAVMSRDGASLCGVFCAVHNVIEQITLDECADVFTAVRQIQIRRPEFCANLEEYELIYRAVHDHIQSASENIYFNQ